MTRRHLTLLPLALASGISGSCKSVGSPNSSAGPDNKGNTYSDPNDSPDSATPGPADGDGSDEVADTGGTTPTADTEVSPDELAAVAAVIRSTEELDWPDAGGATPHYLPYAAGVHMGITQGTACRTHTGSMEGAIDFNIDGADYESSNGIEAVASAAGIVVATTTTVTGFVARSYGNRVLVRHPDGRYSHYAHLAYGRVYVAVGDTVCAGQALGLIGSTGQSSGDHLHYELWDSAGHIVTRPTFAELDPVPRTCEPCHTATHTSECYESQNEYLTCDGTSPELTYPNGGETFEIGESIDILWTPFTEPGEVDIIVYQGPNLDGSDRFLVDVATRWPSSAGRYDGLVFHNDRFVPGAGDYYICITSRDGRTSDCSDSHFAINSESPGADLDGDGFDVAVDCNDTDPLVYPGAPERCNAADDDCDTYADEGVAFAYYYPDADRDGYGSGSGTYACTPPLGHVSNADDCDDGDSATNPAAPEICDGEDNDCDSTLDDNSACWVAIYRFQDPTTGARCWNASTSAPSRCSSYALEIEAWIVPSVSVPGTFHAVQCSKATDHIIVPDGSSDEAALAASGYNCSLSLGYPYTLGSGPPPGSTPFADTCPAWRFRFSTSGGGSHLFTRGADATSSMTCEPPARFEVVTGEACFGSTPSGC